MLFSGCINRCLKKKKKMKQSCKFFCCSSCAHTHTLLHQKKPNTTNRHIDAHTHMHNTNCSPDFFLRNMCILCVLRKYIENYSTDGFPAHKNFLLFLVLKKGVFSLEKVFFYFGLFYHEMSIHSSPKSSISRLLIS